MAVVCSLNTTDFPEVWLASNDHRGRYLDTPKKFFKGSRRNLRTRAGPGSRFGAVPEDEVFFSEDDSPLQDVESEERLSSSWVCTQCTFENHVLLPTCEMCSATAPAAGAQSRVHAKTSAPQGLPDDRASASAWPSLAQAGHRGEEEWDTLSTTSFLNVTDLAATLGNEEEEDDDDVSSVMSFVNLGDAVIKREDSDDDDAKSLASAASFLMVDQALETQVDASAGTVSAPTTTWAARIAAVAARAPPAATAGSSPCLRPAQHPPMSSQKKHRLNLQSRCAEDENESEDLTWGRRGHVHKGRQWQKHRRRVEATAG